MKHSTGIDRFKRMDKSYTEAVALLGDLKGIYDKAEIVAEKLIQNVARRVEWNAQENERRNRAAMAKGEPTPVPLSTMAELETIGRIVATLQDPRLNAFRTADPDAGAREIVRILDLARREYGSGKADTPDGAGIKGAPGGKDKKEGQDDESRQTPTVERPPEPRHRILGHGKVRRGNG